MVYVEAPNAAPTSMFPSVFIAGGITLCPPWQMDLINMIKDLDIVVYNPRRKEFPINFPDAAKGQIRWEYQMLRKASMISFWFCKETIQPIVLLELGSWTMTHKPIIIGMDPAYQRRQDVEIQVELVRPDIKIVYSLTELADDIASTYNNLMSFN